MVVKRFASILEIIKFPREYEAYQGVQSSRLSADEQNVVKKNFIHVLGIFSAAYESKSTPENYFMVMTAGITSISKYLSKGQGAQLTPGARIKLARSLVSQLLSGLKVMRAAGFAHLDIKPDNLLLGQEPMPLVRMVCC